jgi:hypothetical protein
MDAVVDFTIEEGQQKIPDYQTVVRGKCPG